MVAVLEAVVDPIPMVEVALVVDAIPVVDVAEEVEVDDEVDMTCACLVTNIRSRDVVAVPDAILERMAK